MQALVPEGFRLAHFCHHAGTVGTALDHPVKGKTQLFRRNQSLEDLAQIFANPRLHTGGCLACNFVEQ
jgi:hypothetical protein